MMENKVALSKAEEEIQVYHTPEPEAWCSPEFPEGCKFEDDE